MAAKGQEGRENIGRAGGAVRNDSDAPGTLDRQAGGPGQALRSLEAEARDVLRRIESDLKELSPSKHLSTGKRALIRTMLSEQELFPAMESLRRTYALLDLLVQADGTDQFEAVSREYRHAWRELMEHYRAANALAGEAPIVKQAPHLP